MSSNDQYGLYKKTNMHKLLHAPVGPDIFTVETDENPYAKVMLSKNVNETSNSAKTPKESSKSEKRNRWDKSKRREESEFAQPTPKAYMLETPGRHLSRSNSKNEWTETPVARDPESTPSLRKRKRFGSRERSITPSVREFDTPREFENDSDKTPGLKKRSRWDESVRGETPKSSETPMAQLTDATPTGQDAIIMKTPMRGKEVNTRFVMVDKEWDPHSLEITDAEIEAVIPPGYRSLKLPPSYAAKARKCAITATPTPYFGAAFSAGGMTPMPQGQYALPAQTTATMDTANRMGLGAVDEIENIPVGREDQAIVERLRQDNESSTLKPKEREVLTLILKVKNADPRNRRIALRELTRRANEFGAALLLDNIIPLLLDGNIDEQQRHLMVKLLDRLMYKLEDKVRPYTYKILTTVLPLLVDEDHIARQEGREVVSNLSKVVGLSYMISALRPDIDNEDDAVRKVTACCFAVVAHSLGLAPLLKFVKAVCSSRKGWKVRHTGMRIIREIAMTMKCSILPYLHSLVSLVSGGLSDDNQQVKTITVLTISSLAEAVSPYGIEAFDEVLKPLWKECNSSRGKHLAAVIKAISFLIPLMDRDYRKYFSGLIIPIVVHNFTTPDENFKLILLNTMQKLCQTDSLSRGCMLNDVVRPFFSAFWNSRSALVKSVYRNVVETVVAMANIVGVREIMVRVIEHIRADTETFKRMAIETADKILTINGTDKLDNAMVKALIDALHCVFEEQAIDQGNVTINCFGNILNSLGRRCDPFIEEFVNEALFRMGNKGHRTRKQAADVMGRVAKVANLCGKSALLELMSNMLYEYLGEEFPDVLGSIIKAIELVAREKGLHDNKPPVNELLPRLTPILKNRQEKVQESCLELVGFIAESAGDHVNSREWMRVCFDLIEIFKSPKKSIRRVAINSFGYIARSVGPVDVVGALLTNLKTQDRQNRICSTVAIAVVADTCDPTTVLPMLMNEYRVPDLFVQHGVLKSLGFLIEYVGESIGNFTDAITPLLADALTERDIVHRQTAIAAVSHLAINCYGYGREDALVHLLNQLWPNSLEASPHLSQQFMRCIDALRVALGPVSLMQFTVQGLFHPARAVRSAMWRVHNSIFIGNPDAALTAFPRTEDEIPPLETMQHNFPLSVEHPYYAQYYYQQRQMQNLTHYHNTTNATFKNRKYTRYMLHYTL